MATADEDRRLASRDEIELAKSFLEIVRYSSTVVLSMAAVSGAIYKLSVTPTDRYIFDIQADHFLFALSLLVSICHLVAGYTVISHSYAAMLDKLSEHERECALETLRRGPYSIFSVLSGIAVLLWLITIGSKVIMFS